MLQLVFNYFIIDSNIDATINYISINLFYNVFIVYSHWCWCSTLLETPQLAARWMGTVCASPVEEATSNGEAPWVGGPVQLVTADQQLHIFASACRQSCPSELEFFFKGSSVCVMHISYFRGCVCVCAPRSAPVMPGIDAEPLWKQVADEQIARKKNIKACNIS